MHSIKNILERNKIDTQSRADTYIRRTRLISKSDYNLKSGCTWKCSWNWKNPKNPLVWAKKSKKPKKNPKKTKKNPKNPQKNPLGWFFLKKPGFFPTLIKYDKITIEKVVDQKTPCFSAWSPKIVMWIFSPDPDSTFPVVTDPDLGPTF
jgi:hypothetical protein